MSDDNFKGGVEWYDVDDIVGEVCQCARCGSSCGSDVYHEDLNDEEGTVFWFCLSSPEWCEANPMKGREHVRGAGPGCHGADPGPEHVEGCPRGVSGMGGGV